MVDKKLENQKNNSDNPIFDLIFTIALPSLVLVKLSKPDLLGETKAFFVALAFPLGYLLWKAIQTKKFNLISGLGLFNVLASGGLFFLKADILGFALKEALMPTILGCVLVFSSKDENGFLAKILYNDSVFNRSKISECLNTDVLKTSFSELLIKTTWIAASSFVLSAVLNFYLAFYFLKSPVGSEAFNSEMGQMTMWSWPCIVLPSMLLNILGFMFLVRGLRKLTGLTFEEIIAQKTAEKSSPG